MISSRLPSSFSISAGIPEVCSSADKLGMPSKSCKCPWLEDPLVLGVMGLAGKHVFLHQAHRPQDYKQH